MKKNLIFSIVISSISLLVACSDNTKPKEDEKKIPNGNQINHCYSFATSKDTVFMKLHISGKTITGDLKYKYFEKDQNNGTLEGTIHGDTLFAAYTFMSEGIESVREVVFLKTSKGFAEGYGDMQENEGKMEFKENISIVFNNNMVLKPVKCANLKAAIFP